MNGLWVPHKNPRRRHMLLVPDQPGVIEFANEDHANRMREILNNMVLRIAVLEAQIEQHQLKESQ